MSKLFHRHRYKKKKFMYSAVYYLVVIALVIGLVFIIREDKHNRLQRTNYKEQIASQETEEDIGFLDDMMVRPTEEPTKAPTEAPEAEN